MKRNRVALFVMVDALGFNFLRTHDFLPELEYRVGLRTVLGYSCANQPTLLSGKMPPEHGHGAMFQRRQGESVLDAARPFHRLPSFLADNWRVRQRIHGRVASQVEGYFSLYECPTRLLPEFDLVERKVVFEPGGLRRARNIFDELEELQLQWRSYYWKTPEAQNIQAARGDLERGDVDFVFLYLPALDGLLHQEGSQGPRVQEHLRWYETQLRELYTVAQEHSEIVEYFLFSDHGMSDVHGGLDLKSKVEATLGRNGDRYLAFYDSTLARFWYEEETVATTLRNLLGSERAGRILHQEELGAIGADFPDRTQGDLVWAANEGMLILPSYMGKEMLAGMHGYHPDAVDADACLLGPMAPSEDLTHIRDLFDLMLRVAHRVKASGAAG